MSSVRTTFNNASKKYNEHALVQKEIATRTNNKLDFINPNEETIIDLGAGTGLLSEKLIRRFPESKVICIDFAYNSLKSNKGPIKVCADANNLPIQHNSVDIIISSLMMQWCPNLNNLFEECYRVLKNDGLFLFSTFGPDTLKELKKSWSIVDNKAHVNTFTDMHDIGDKILNNGFQNPVMEMEMLAVQYDTVIDLLHDIKGIGAQTVTGRSKSLTGKNKFNAMIEMYESYRVDTTIPATYEVIYGHAWKKTNTLGPILVNN
jgi:malonyl-CoA O-methyltransferase